MLDKIKLARELDRMAGALFADSSHDLAQVKACFQAIANDPTFIYKVREAHVPWPLPFWQGRLDDAFAVSCAPDSYDLLSVDGSQVYPDRHSGISCFLINIGTVILRYGTSQGSTVFLDSQPYLFGGDDYCNEGVSPTEWVNCRRQELEFKDGLVQARKLFECIDAQVPLVLFDGSLIFWHLEAKDTVLRDAFLASYIAVLDSFYRAGIPYAGYISAPKSREIVNLVKLALCQFDLLNVALCKPAERMVDTTIVRFFLNPGERTTVFQNNASISDYYAPYLRTHFFYLHTGDEIGRVEIPAFSAHDEQLLNTVASIILDQCQKGLGYPVALAEAHEQAVVKGVDREFFYHLLGLYESRLGRQAQGLSFKSMRKRCIGV